MADKTWEPEDVMARVASVQEDTLLLGHQVIRQGHYQEGAFIVHLALILDGAMRQMRYVTQEFRNQDHTPDAKEPGERGE